MAWFHRLANVFRSDRVRGEIDEEVRYHLNARMADNRASGMSAAEARADALRRFGGEALAVDRARDADVFVWLESILQDLRFGWRNLRRNPGTTAVALVSLAVAIGANTAIFSVVNAVLLRALPYRDAGRIVSVPLANSLRGAEVNATVPDFEDWRQRARSLGDFAMYREGDAAVLIDGQPDWIEFAWVHGDFFRLMGRSPALGRAFDADAGDGRQVVLSHRLWQSRFGGAADVVGRTINLSGIDFAIAGVMPDDFAFPSKDTLLWAPAAALPNWRARRADRTGGFGSVLARLAPGSTLEQARAEMRVISRQLAAEYPEAHDERIVSLVPLAAGILGKTVPFLLAILSGAVFLVLLIAGANAANLLLARGAVRRREIALRTAIGAGRARILRQLLTESALLSLFAGALALPIAAWAVPAIAALAPQGMARLDEARIDWRVLAFSFGLSLASGMVFGIAPALRISRPVGARRETAGVDARALRRALAAGEVALAVMLLTGAGLLIRSFLAVQAVDPGFRMDRVLAATLRFRNTLTRGQRAALYRDAMNRIGELPGVAAAGGVSTMFYTADDAKFGLRAVEGKPAESRDRWTAMTWSTISGDYFQALGVPLLRGRFFNDRDTLDSTPVAIINETMARRYWPGEDPVGKGLKGFDPRGHNDEWVRVIGVVKDMRNRGLEHAAMAQIYQPQAQSLDETENLVVRGQVSAGLLRDTIRSIDRTAVWSEVSTLADRLREQTAPRRFQTLLVTLFSVIALVLAAAGLFGMMHYSVAQRTQEIGIRMAIGARPRDVLRMVMGEGLLLVAAGVGAGLAGSLALTRALRGLLFEVAPGDPVTLASVALLLAAVALAACWLPARRATRVDPMLALRCE